MILTYTLSNTPPGVYEDDTGAFIPDEPSNIDWQHYQDWLAAGNTPNPAPIPPAPVPSCQLWQLQATLTPAQWTAVQSAIAAMNNPVLTAFSQHGTNVIPANSTTLAQLATAIGIDPSTLPALITAASKVAIP
jgi:hypothetical protein